MRSRTRLGSTGSKSQQTEHEGIKLTPLTIDEVRRLPKPHTGFEAFVEPLAALVRDYPDELGTGGIDVDAMREALASYSALAGPRADAAKQLALIDDTRLLFGSSAWAQQLAIYARARIAARTNVDVKRAIEEFERFMKNGPHKKTAKPSTPTTPTT